MPINVSVNIGKMEQTNGPFDIKKAQYALMDQAMSDMDQFVPKLSGHLRGEVHLNDDNDEITYTEPYARAQFYGFIHGYRAHIYTTPGTNRRWDLRAKSLFMSKWLKAFEDGGFK
ncbi:minor capsid protein [Secundilactobacillus pentosiphilus]|uniref:Minor capsid protein n=1 Tax=Secundilactobacillus pentosiphilus TaxID=1714682 RepID=A0A1Z5IZA6_9LACO|nr:minor capsid protein [Secundilactobacillus pentosiphilus]GAX06811.1 minor capsid protein [Secundilactobacillus pentosiphilus]